ncbi:dicarboxylate/amino acid:cation symporter [Microbacterium sp. 22242]|uniref:dicarboxylate/amino acid:cation symporter n=1 Tax=Microbacterium sp. 22242 TaxID=3453896 RepID=UPI003F82B06A
MSNTTTAARRPQAPVTRGPVRKLLTSFGFQIIVALVLGIAAGLIGRQFGATADHPTVLSDTLAKIGGSYVTILRAAVVPLVFTAIVASISNLRRVQNAARLAGQTILWFAITAFIAVSIGIVLGITIQPGAHAGTGLEKAAPHTVGTWWNFLLGLIPQNFLGIGVSSAADPTAGGAIVSTVNFNILQIIVIAAAVGIAALKAGRKAEPFLVFTESLLKVIQRVLWWIIRIAPLGTFGLIGSAVINYGWDKLTSLAWFAGAIYIGLAIVMFVVYPILVKSHGLSIKQYFTGVWPAVQLGFVSRSSIGTLPLTERVTERNLGVPRGYASFAVPLGATTKMDGCAAIYPAVAAIFVAQFFGLQLNLMQYILIVVVSVVGSAATAGTTGAIVMLTLTLSTLGLPLEGVGLLIAIDPILDMGRTALNVAGQALVPTIVAKREGILDLDLYNAPRNGLPFAEDIEDETAADDEAGSPDRAAAAAGSADAEETAAVR